MKILVSRCLLGDNCKYNGGTNYQPLIARFLKKHEAVPVCPEVLGGLPTPRCPAEIVDGVVRNRDGVSVDRQFRLGAERALKIAQEQKIDCAILQSRSPSCGCREIYDGTFQGGKIKAKGVFAELLGNMGCMLVDQEELCEALTCPLLPATPGMEQELLQFYRSMLGSPFCVWNQQYPSMLEIERDISTGCVYYWSDEKGIAGTVSIDDDPELDEMKIWTIRNARELARIAVRTDLRQRKIPPKMLLQIFMELKDRGYDGVHLLVDSHHLPARKCYERMGFVPLGTAELFERMFICYERKLGGTIGETI